MPPKDGTPSDKISTPKENGRYSLAGFLYQILGSAGEVIKLCEISQSQDEITGLVAVEQFGQDSAQFKKGILCCLTQYKYSTVGDSIPPSELREILEKFNASTKLAGESIKDVSYVLSTNRAWSHDSEALWKKRNDTTKPVKEKKSEIKARLKRSSKTPVNDLDALTAIYLKLETENAELDELRESLEAEASSFGVLQEEIASKIFDVIGLILSKSVEDAMSVIGRNEIDTALAGYPNPMKLMSEGSREVRKKEVRRFLMRVNSGTPTRQRSVLSKIRDEIIKRPVVILTGDGGCGKSIAIADIAMSYCEDENRVPGFVLIDDVANLAATKFIHSVAEWRNLGSSHDGHIWSKSIKRLSITANGRPVLLVCADGIDERHGIASLPSEADKFLGDLIFESQEQFSSGKPWDVGILLSCRTFDDLEVLGLSSLIENNPAFCEINLTEFLDEEIYELAEDISDTTISSRVKEHCRKTSPTSSTLSQTPISDNVFRLLRHPVLWGAFLRLDGVDQKRVLDGEPDSSDLLAARYIEWFRLKVAKRVQNLDQFACNIVLTTSARANNAQVGTGDYMQHWVKASVANGCVRNDAVSLFKEAKTAGMIEVVQMKGSTKWRWVHPWVQSYLERHDEESL
ncbi:hypothetical protein AB1K70_24930 [Bremerella sp. JC770]|uniref:hypothetical protein n=1 Tax=Bremerella sp. JC770 TaxID=3232137 RepID=UPI0034586184